MISSNHSFCTNVQNCTWLLHHMFLYVPWEETRKENIHPFPSKQSHHSLPCNVGSFHVSPMCIYIDLKGPPSHGGFREHLMRSLHQILCYSGVRQILSDTTRKWVNLPICPDDIRVCCLSAHVETCVLCPTELNRWPWDLSQPLPAKFCTGFWFWVMPDCDVMK